MVIRVAFAFLVTLAVASPALSGCAPPVVAVQPQSQVARNGLYLMLTATTSGTPANWTWYLGETGDTSRPVSSGVGTAYLYRLQQSSANFWARFTNTCGGGPADTATARIEITHPMSGDYNGDGRDDLMLRHVPASEIGLWLLSGSTIVSGSGYVAPEGTSRVLSAGDLNGDGRTDLVLIDQDGALRVWLMSGRTIIGGGRIGPTAGMHLAGLGDFNGDGKDDILLRGRDGTLSIWLMNGGSIIGGAVAGRPGEDYDVRAVADFNGDGMADILLYQGTSLGVWLMNGVTLMAGGYLGDHAGLTVQGVADFDGDGRADVLFRDNLGSLGMWFVNGWTIVGGGSVGSLDSSLYTFGFGDYNGDGRADIAIAQYPHNLVRVWFMNGATITSSRVVGLATSSYELN